MLVLSRKSGQTIRIGDGVTIRVTKIKGNRVTLGIEAPDNVRIVRGELEPLVNEFRVVNGSESTETCEEPPALPLTDGTTPECTTRNVAFAGGVVACAMPARVR